ATFLRYNSVKFELPEREVQPWAVEHIVEPRVDCFNMEGASFIGCGNQLEGDVLFQRAGAQDVEAAVVKAAEGQPAQAGRASRRVISDFVGAFAVPEWRHAEGDWPIRRILPYRRIAVVHQLIAVILELLSKVIQHRPGLVARRTSQPIFSGEGWQCIRTVRKGEKKTNEQKQTRETSSGRNHRLLLVSPP